MSYPKESDQNCQLCVICQKECEAHTNFSKAYLAQENSDTNIDLTYGVYCQTAQN